MPEMARGRPDYSSSALAKEPVLDFAAIFRHAAQGDVCAEAIREHSLLVWSSLAVNLIHAYDPELVIFGGGIMASADVILPAVREYVLRHAHTPWGKVRVEASELGDSAALVAGEWLLQEQFPNL
jgi:glucokinase